MFKPSGLLFMAIILWPNSQNKFGAILYVAPFAQSKTIFNFFSDDVLFKVLFKNSEYLPEASSNLFAFPDTNVLFVTLEYFLLFKTISSTFCSIDELNFVPVLSKNLSPLYS